MKLKRVTSALLSVALLMTMTATTAFAKNNKNNSRNNTGVPYGIAKKFVDLEKFPWAERAIEKMRSKGLLQGKQNGKYDPQGEVTQLESIIMALRVMGWESDSKKYTKLPERYKGNKVDNWATGYVSLAFEKGILDDVDLMYFNPNQPAKRHEVAKYVIRALGYNEEALDHMDEDLSFKDAAAIPQGSIGYVYLIEDLGLMVGDNGKFNPMGTLTRAEMAVLFQRLDDKVENDIDQEEYKGKIHKISEESITLNVDDELLTFKLSDDISVYINNKKYSISRLVKGDTVSIQLDRDEVIYIEVVKDTEEEKIISQYSGVVTELKDNKITIQIDKMTIVFEAINDIKVSFEDEDGSLDDLLVGDSVTITVDTRNRAREISVNRTIKNETYEGEIYKLGTNYLYLTIGDKNVKLNLAVDALVTIDEGKSEYKKLTIGMNAEVKVKNGLAYEINAESGIITYEGEIYKLGTNYFYLTIGDKNVKLNLADDALVTIDEEESEFEDLKVGMNAQVKVKNDKVYVINADIIIETVESKIIAIKEDSEGCKLTLLVNAKEIEFLVDDDVEITSSVTTKIDIDDLTINQKCKFSIKNEIITKIEIL